MIAIALIAKALGSHCVVHSDDDIWQPPITNMLEDMI